MKTYINTCGRCGLGTDLMGGHLSDEECAAARNRLGIAEPSVTLSVANATSLPLQDQSVDLVIGSPPYPWKGRRYGDDGPKWQSVEWVCWMTDVTREALRVCRGPVLWVVNGTVRQGVYEPAVEGLLWSAWVAGLTTERPVIWHKNAPPNRRDWFGNDWEYVVAFRGDGERVWNWEAIAEPPKFKSGGRFRQRDAKGKRRLGNSYPKSELARPRDVLRVTVGGGHMGAKLAHQGEAPFPEKLVEPFVRALTNPGGVVCDPFVGTGTTCAVALRHGRRSIGFDNRAAQLAIAVERLGIQQTAGVA